MIIVGFQAVYRHLWYWSCRNSTWFLLNLVVLCGSEQSISKCVASCRQLLLCCCHRHRRWNKGTQSLFCILLAERSSIIRGFRKQLIFETKGAQILARTKWHTLWLSSCQRSSSFAAISPRVSGALPLIIVTYPGSMKTLPKLRLRVRRDFVNHYIQTSSNCVPVIHRGQLPGLELDAEGPLDSWKGILGISILCLSLRQENHQDLPASWCRDAPPWRCGDQNGL